MHRLAACFGFALRTTFVGLFLALGGCATYAPHPLDVRASAQPDIAGLHHDTPLPTHLDLADVAHLARLNNPDLIAARAAHGVAVSQERAASILPNPVFGGSYQEVLSGPGTLATLAAGLSQDLKALVTYSSKRRSARDSTRSVDAAIVWQEWQTVGKVRLSAIDVIEGANQLALLRDSAALWSDRVTHERQALNQGNATLATLAPDLAAAADAQKQVDDFERQQQARARDLNVLLGLAPSAKLLLVDTIRIEPFDADAARRYLEDLANRRPDLIALQLGYRAQEEKVRAAILAQFPLFSLGYAYGRDTSNVRTLGPQLTMDLPVFDRNQGSIAQERATREQLHAEFNARLIAARSEIEALLADHALLQRQRDAKRSWTLQMQPAAAQAAAAFRHGDIDQRSYVDLVTTYNAKCEEVLAIELTLLEQQVAIETLIGAGMPAVTLAEATATGPVIGATKR